MVRPARWVAGAMGRPVGGSEEECVVTSLAPLGIAVALYVRGSNNGVSKDHQFMPLELINTVM